MPAVGEALARAAVRKHGPRRSYVRTAPGNGPDGLKLRAGEDPVMTPEQSAWVDELYIRFGRLVERMVVNRLTGTGVEYAKAYGSRSLCRGL